MAKFKLNKIVESASGKVGQNMMFKQVGRVTLFASTPEFDAAKTTEKQRTQRERFKRAAQYARTIVADPVKKAAYAKSVEGKEFMNAFTAAVTDYLDAPKVDNIDYSLYTGNAGEPIVLSVFDSFKVASVAVTIMLADGTQVETGAAVEDAENATWKYVTTQVNAAVAGSKIKVVVKDKPGNTTEFEQVI